VPFALAHPTQLSKTLSLHFTVWRPLSTELPNLLTFDLLTYLLTDLVTYLHAWCQENNCILYKRFILEEKSSLHLISLNPTLRKNPFLPPKKQLFENKRGEKKRSPNLYTEKPL